MKCPICEKGELILKSVKYSVYGIDLGVFPAKACPECREEWFDEKTSRKIEELEKKKRLFGISKRSKVSYSGNSLIIRIPESIASFMSIKKEDEFVIHPEGKGKLCVEFV